MGRKPNPVPKHCRRSNGRGFVKVSGRVVYTGRFGTPEADARYKQIVAAHLAGNEPPEKGSAVTVGAVAALYVPHVHSRHADKRHRNRVDLALRGLEPFGNQDAATFRPRQLKQVRAAWVAAGLERGHINARVYEVVRMFRWAAGEELLPGSVVADLKAIEPLRRGEPGVVENDPRRPVPPGDFGRAVKRLPPMLRVAALVQFLTGMRPAEVLGLSAPLIERKADVWTYRPAKHKGQRRGLPRAVLIGPRAQRLLAPLLQVHPAGPLLPTHAGNFYRVDSYGHAIRRACVKAGVAPWVSYQCRHARVSLTSATHGPDAARRQAGQRSLAATQIYDAMMPGAALDAARRAG
jgi:integrase